MHISTNVLIVVIIILAVLALQYWRSRNYNYRCDNCGNVFSLSFLASAVAPHAMMGKKYVKCPRCGRWGWATPVPK